jgi:hypothetical protein
MKADATKTKRSAKTTATKRKRSTTTSKQERGIPFEEMKRLMDTYGSTKCLRKRQQKPSPPSKDGTKDEAAQSRTKIDSIKRKFYRWFPDLDERFVRDVETGNYIPKIGHENELKYRQDMRLKDGQILSKKRAKCRKERNGNNNSRSSAANTSARRVTTTTAAQGRWASSTTSSTTSTGGNVMMINSFYNMPNNNKAVVNIITPSSSTVSDTSNNTNATRESPVVDPRGMPMSTPSSYVNTTPLPIISASSLPPLPSINTKSNMNIANCDEDNDYFASSMNFGDVPLPQMPTSSSTSYNNNNNSDDDLQSITSDEPVDQSFTAKSGIFDDVEQDFFGLVESRHPLVIEECAASKVSSSSSSSSSSLEGGGCHDELKRSSSNSTIDDINDMLEKSIEECCEEIFSGDEQERSVSGSGYIFDMIST